MHNGVPEPEAAIYPEGSSFSSLRSIADSRGISEDRFWLCILMTEMGDNEIRVLRAIAERLVRGQRIFGELYAEKKNWGQELYEEIIDGLVYASCAISLGKEKGSRKPRKRSTDKPSDVPQKKSPKPGRVRKRSSH